MRRFVSHLHVQLAALRGDGQRPVSQLPRQVEGLAHRLLQGQPHRVLFHRRLHRRAHLLRGAEVPVGRHKPANALVRAPEIVGVDEVPQSPRAVVEVGEHGAPEEFVPQRLPEALHLAQRLRVVRSTLEVCNSLPPQLGLEFRLPAPRGVLAAVVGQRFARHAEAGHAAFEGLHHQRRLLVVCQRVPDDEAAVVVHEDGDVEPFMPTQQEGEDVRLPELVWLGPLEARLGPRRLLELYRPRLEQPFLMKNPPHRRL